MVKVEFSPTKNFALDEAPPQIGSFAVDEPTVNWYKCREQYANKFSTDCTGMFFSHERGHEHSERVAYFMSVVEEILDLKERSKYAKCTKNFAMWICPAPFWLDCEMKRSLYTILLRCGLEYDVDKNNFETALYSVNYLNETKLAVMRFLFGFTKYSPDSTTGYVKGWWTEFKNKSEDQIKKQLVSPEAERKDECIVGVGTLWA